MIEEKNYAAIDIGTNAARLLIKSVRQEAWGEIKSRKVLFLRYPLRLGEDVFTKGKIGKEKEKSMTNMILAFRQLMIMHQVEDYRACATSAMREAVNGSRILKKMLKDTGIEIDIIDGKEEADMLYGNRVEKLPIQTGTFMYIDVGGGSTEITLIHDGKLIGSMSYDIGTLRMLNKAVKEGIKDSLHADMQGIHANFGCINIIGSGGSINKLFRMTDDKNIQEMKLPVKSLQRVYHQIKSMNIKDRIEILGLNPDRADVIVPAAEIFLMIAQSVKAEYIYVPTIGLVDGIIERLLCQIGKTEKQKNATC